MLKLMIVSSAAALAFIFALGFPRNLLAFERTPQKPAIVLAAFGTTEVKALNSILNIKMRVQAAFPGYDVHLAFTSNIIRDIWHKRAADAKFKKANPGVSAEIYGIKNALTTLADIQEGGARLVLVQSLHVTDGEEYEDLVNLVKALEGYKTMKPVLHPFPWIGVGEPALGVDDGRPKYLQRAARALAPYVEAAQKSGRALVLMGHGNEHLAQGVYKKFQAQLRRTYANEQIYIGTVEAPPHAEDLVKAIKKSAAAPESVLLVPMMVVAGDHARNDMAGDEPDSWAGIFKANGFSVQSHLEGLGSNDAWADIYVEHLKALETAVKGKQAADK
ncbi:MAG: sirohydrochlorin cobaltochelatase [Candidatus Adiutrix sp.]|jgi:sirohydrochlorin cobaltochelatase|nr:sirohydrochlorin cobaltochelatase [Candidatus Adiutrix sp.]